MKTKQELIDAILESGATYVRTSISNEACAVAIAIRDIEDADQIPKNIWFKESSTGLDINDY